MEDDHMTPAFLSLIEGSKISLVIFSEDYASWQRRLDELEKIMECRSKYGQIVVPIYHNIDPSVVECQNGIYRDAFARHELEFDNHKVQGWRDAMSEAARLVGWHTRSVLPRSEPVDEIIEDVLHKLNPSPQAAYTDAYISFSAVDPIKMFATQLYHALSRRRIRVSKDDQFRKGDLISECRTWALETSKITLIIFSEGYARSQRCLDELLKAINCRRRNAQIVIPIFYDVSPSEVQHQRAKFELAFQNIEKVQIWRHALSEAADIPGFNLLFSMGSYDKSEEIAEDVFRKLNPIHSQLVSTSGVEVTLPDDEVSIDGQFDPTSDEWVAS